ncbi:MAG: type III pantothenate kinase [Nitrospinae bacterium]|nr:type III pantothenate kinase [Nitrospinota bacterium]
MEEIAIDVGNSYTKVSDKTDSFSSISNNELETFFHHADIFDTWKGKKVFIASVVPSLTPFFKERIKPITNELPYIIGLKDFNCLNIEVETAATIGVDRLINAVAVTKNYKKDALIIDVGTATTIDVVTADGTFKGGLIFPGFETFRSSLFANTEQLSFVKEKLELEKSLPEQYIGKNSYDAIKSGVYGGYCAMIKGLTEKVKGEIDNSVTVIATGGGVKHIDISSLVDIVDLSLSIKGIRALAQSL